jgi:hypothetical protein
MGNDTGTFDPTTFDYQRARRAVDLWVDHLNDKHVNWAWEILMGTTEVYAQFALPPGGTLEQARAKIWHDFFDAWHDGAANHGILGIMTELSASCPYEHDADLDRIMRLAWEAGRTGTSVPKDLTWCMSKTVGTRGRPVATEAQRVRAEAAAARSGERRDGGPRGAGTLRLVVGQGQGRPASGGERPSFRLLPGRRPLAGQDPADTGGP